MNEKDINDTVIDVGVQFEDKGGASNAIEDELDDGNIAVAAVGIDDDSLSNDDEINTSSNTHEPEDAEFVAVDETSGVSSATTFAERMLQKVEQDRIQEGGISRTTPKFDYEYKDTESFVNELDDWFTAEETSKFPELKKAYYSRFKKWKRSSTLTRKQVLADLLDELIVEKGKDFSKRGKSAIACLCYISEGAYGEVNDQDQHIQQIKENCKLIWRSGGLPVIYEQIERIIEMKVPNDLTMWSVDDEINQGGGLNGMKGVEHGVGGDEQKEDSLNNQLHLLLTIFYLIVETLRDEKDDLFISDLDNLSPPILTYYTDVIGRLRWNNNKHLLNTFPITKINLIIWKCILILFGGRENLSKVKKFMREKYKLPNDYDESSDIVTASPLDYHAFREDLISRYPSYVPPPSKLPKSLENTQSISHFIQVARPTHTQPSNTSLPAPTIHIATPAPSPPLSPAITPGQKLRKSVFMTNQSFPFLYPTDNEVPQSIVEAGELFASRIRTTTALIQLWEERDKFMRYERGWSGKEGEDNDGNINDEGVNTERDKQGQFSDNPLQKILDRIDKFYHDSLLSINSFLSVQLRLILKNNVFLSGRVDDSNTYEIEQIRIKDITMKSISAILDLLLSWYKVDHILKFEFLSILLFDSRYYLFVYKYLYSHNVLEKALFIPKLDSTFFNITRGLSDEWVEIDGKNDFNGDDYNGNGISINTTTNNGNISQNEITSYSSTYLFTLISFIKILRKIVKNKTQRIIIVAELPSETLKQALTIYQQDLWRIVLDLFKEQVPFNGKKWKFNNMDLISAIYLNCKTKLRDDWLSGVDVNAEIDDAYPQEVALRSLVKFFNDHGSLHEEYQQNDFFAQELDALTIGSN